MSYSYPVLIKAKLRMADRETLLRLVRLMENVTFRVLLKGSRASIESRLQKVLREAEDNEGFNKMIDNVKSNIKNNRDWRFWNDDEVFGRLGSGWFFGNKVDNYLLWRYEWHLCKDEYPNPKIHFSDLIKNESIDHIAPQTENKDVESGYGIYEDNFNKTNGIVSGEWMHCVGNLVLMAGAENSSLGNRPFSCKLRVFGCNNLLHQQKEIINFVEDRSNPVWDKDCIERRCKKIVEAAKAMWDLNNI